MGDVHARWSGRKGRTFCGASGLRVTIRTPDDWARVTCPTCVYAATHD